MFQIIKMRTEKELEEKIGREKFIIQRSKRTNIFIFRLRLFRKRRERRISISRNGR